MSFQAGYPRWLSNRSKLSREPITRSKKTGNKETGRMCLNRLRTYDGRNLYGVSGECIAALRAERSARDKLTLLTPGQRMNMEFKEYDFARNPVVQNEVFFLQSKCAPCSFSILVRSIEELVEHERLHRTHVARQMPLHREEA